MEGRGTQLAGGFLVAAMSCLAPMDAQAVMFSFSGTVTGLYDLDNYLPADIQAGQPISGTLSYSLDNVADLSPGNPESGTYRFIGAALGDISMTVQLTTPDNVHVFTSVVAPVNGMNAIEVRLPAAGTHSVEYLHYDALMNGQGFQDIAWTLLALSFRENAGGVLGSDAVPTTLGALNGFGTRQVTMGGYRPGGFLEFQITAQVTSLSVVPEPGEWAMLAGGALGMFGLVRRMRR